MYNPYRHKTEDEPKVENVQYEALTGVLQVQSGKFEETVFEMNLCWQDPDCLNPRMAKAMKFDPCDSTGKDKEYSRCRIKLYSFYLIKTGYLF